MVVGVGVGFVGGTCVGGCGVCKSMWKGVWVGLMGCVGGVVGGAGVGVCVSLWGGGLPHAHPSMALGLCYWLQQQQPVVGPWVTHSPLQTEAPQW